MLHLTALHIENFGPFKGHQTVNLASKEGVTVVYGENMRGKTSLLNAIRFAFFGKVIGRGTKALPLHKVGNWEQAALGRFGFQVQLDFEDDQQVYKLTRSCRPRSGTTLPSEDEDYVVDYYLEKNGSVLGPHQAEAELKRILPEQISRFFLFDGELLQEYEDLLSSETDMGRRISEAIERILGVPVLTSARASLIRLKEKSEHREATAAQGDQKTREFGNQLADLHAQRDVLNDDLQRLEHDLEDARSLKASLEEAMKKKERLAALLDKRDTLDRLMKEIAIRRAAKETELQQAMSGAWCSLLAEPIQGAKKSLRELEAARQTELLRADVLASLHANAGSECPACLQQVSPEARKRIESSIHATNADERQEKERELQSIRRKLAALEQYSGASRTDILKFHWDAVEEAAVDYASKKGERDEIAKQLESVDEESLRKTKTDFENTIRHIDVLEKGVTRTRDLLDQNKSDAENIQKRLDKLSGGNLAGERRRRELYSDLHRLFDDAVGAYREQLRQRVEADATRHFKALTTEPEYAGLRINDSYGLTIVHQDGSDIPVRSAGAEHVVALCLMGSLQNNAPLRGPIIIDSPFGRLDRGHTRNIVRALPTMAKQVVLLVYEDELPPDLARDELKSKLRGEWRLERISARHTELAPRKD
ncbi:chromosome segregation protein [Caballeronia temeraria]|uniref:Chromosome segregation protein n=1 Tax=Caballeronia temeraria TaxID=1777137 RepID=A0A158C0I9_9BURK|nr:AAA family ATPase [Caballeronia temeraria]SAK75027.1 chromosome segregation protein [Caballeronia temeraria]